MDYLNGAKGPVRLKDTATHPDLVERAEIKSLAKTLLGVPIYHQDEHIGSIYLMDKEGGQGFSDEDEDIAVVLAARAASIISNERRHEGVRQAKADLETLLEISPVAVSVFDVRMGQITYMNRESRRLLNAVTSSIDDIATIFLSLKFTRPGGRELAFSELPGTRALQSGEAVIAEEIVIHRQDGTTLPTLVNCAPIFSESGELVSVVTVIQDMTPLEDQEVKRANFLEMVSEELATPLLSIKGSAAALRNNIEPTPPTENLQLLRIIEQQSDLMRGQVNSLIELAQIETGTLSLTTEPANVAGLIETSCGEYRREHAATAIQFDIAAGLSTVLADRQRISKVLHNFLRRAAVYSHEASPVVVSAVMADIHVAISVSVDGPSTLQQRAPLPDNASEHPQLFQMATQAHIRAAELEAQGEGLAMAFCRGVVEAHGGRISSEVDEQGGRLTLSFTLPSVEEEEEVQTSGWRDMSGAPASSHAEATAEATKVLVSIEDAKLLRMVREALLDAGYGTVAASGLNEVEALALSEKPKLILLDIAGREEASFRTLRGAGDPLNLPAIVLCDRDDEEYVVRAFEMGADGYMVKPFSPSELIARIKATLRRMWVGAEPLVDRTFQLGDMEINLDGRGVTVSEEPVQLTATEYKLLIEFAKSPGRVLTQDMLLQRVWGQEYSGEVQLLRSYIKSLRQKLGDDARKPTYIFTEHGVGYRLAKPETTAYRF